MNVSEKTVELLEMKNDKPYNKIMLKQVLDITSKHDNKNRFRLQCNYWIYF